MQPAQKPRRRAAGGAESVFRVGWELVVADGDEIADCGLVDVGAAFDQLFDGRPGGRLIAGGGVALHQFDKPPLRPGAAVDVSLGLLD